ncbi:hypothetical protein D6C78_07991 [Aureobasidium pullulans]|uniref:Uncharacterized protein n=1 Tax=Aureobasidium pullulans TaxID=5580 RepID=A0A4T0BL89_AURPU|nr:hypothetical protein D6C78_07991 [Aureobasidium pullulans]
MPHSAVHKCYKQTLGVTGKVTLKFAINLAVPRDLTKSSDLAAASRYQDFILGIMANPLFLGKQCPSEVLATPNLNFTALTADQISYSPLGYVWNTFKPSGILIAEFGFNPFMESEKKPVEQLYDLERSLYHEGFLKETLKSMHLDGVNVIGGILSTTTSSILLKSVWSLDGQQDQWQVLEALQEEFFDLVDFFHKYGDVAV